MFRRSLQILGIRITVTCARDSGIRFVLSSIHASNRFEPPQEPVQVHNTLRRLGARALHKNIDLGQCVAWTQDYQLRLADELPLAETP